MTRGSPSISRRDISGSSRMKPVLMPSPRASTVPYRRRPETNASPISVDSSATTSTALRLAHTRTRPIPLHDDPPEHAALAPVVVAVGPVHDRAVVDDQHVTLAPEVVID